MPTTDSSIIDRLRSLCDEALAMVAEIPEPLTPFLDIKARRSEAARHVHVRVILLGHDPAETAALVDLAGMWGTPHDFEAPGENFGHWTLIWRRGNVLVEAYGPGVDRFVAVSATGAPRFVIPEEVAS